MSIAILCVLLLMLHIKVVTFGGIVGYHQLAIAARFSAMPTYSPLFDGTLCMCCSCENHATLSNLSFALGSTNPSIDRGALWLCKVVIHYCFVIHLSS